HSLVSVISFLQEIPQAPPRAMEMDRHGRRRHAESLRDLLCRLVIEVEEDEDGSLTAREPVERDQHRRRLLVDLVARLADCSIAPSLPQLRRCDAEGHLPDPRTRIADRSGGAKRPGEGLGDRIARHLWIAGVGEQSPPQAAPPLSVEALEIRALGDLHVVDSSISWVAGGSNLYLAC